jgi:bla regulator protein blaR1
MASLSQSAFLQSIGWAILNSFWQMAILWCIYAGMVSLFRLSAVRRYQLAVLGVCFGFGWFITTAVIYLNSSHTGFYALFDNVFSESNSFLNSCLLAASVSYLALLIIPAYRLLNNWRFVQYISNYGLSKAHLDYRLFTHKMAGYLGISKKVQVFISELVSSPVTIGYLKPIILLPLATINNLSESQVEAVLVHELSHIKRYDYLVNFIVSIISTLLYFNPFMKLFMKQVEAERENCCDELVLQFGYDKIGYASALLTLEKVSAQHRILALGATGKKNLLTRIEKIVGMEKKKGYSLAQFIPVFAALVCILVFNSVLIIKDTKTPGNIVLASSTVMNPFYFSETGGKVKTTTPLYRSVPENCTGKIAATNHMAWPIKKQALPELNLETIDPVTNITKNIHNVVFDEVDGSLNIQQKTQVKTTVEATKKVLKTLEWQEVENSMADAMSREEKAVAKEQYMNEVDNVNWENLEQNLKANYDNIDWSALNAKLGSALTRIQLDSIQASLNQLLVQLEKAESNICAKKNTSTTPLPDQSLGDLRKAIEQVHGYLEQVNTLRQNKVIHL